MTIYRSYLYLAISFRQPSGSKTMELKEVDGVLQITHKTFLVLKDQWHKPNVDNKHYTKL